jgi:hypothetical protein
MGGLVLRKSWMFDLGAAVAELKNLSHEHSIDGKLSEKIDDVVERLLDEIKTTRKEVIFNWRIMQILMASALLVQFMI